jgi:ABC-type polysaccharide/polyol phosphate transport system ATPase subunit
MPILEARGIVKRFRIPSVRRSTVREHVLGMLRPPSSEDLLVLDGVSFAVEPGETIGIMGRNGSGKSTLLKILSGIYAPDRGEVIARGAITPILELGAGWNPELDAIDNIMLIGSVLGMSLRELRRSTDEILAFAELERFANMKLQHYSSGMASRLAYAVGFQAARDVLILDEIFAVGDAGFRRRCEERYRKLHANGGTVIVVSHEVRTISVFCSRAVLLDSGRITKIASGKDVADAYVALLTQDGIGIPAATH